MPDLQRRALLKSMVTMAACAGLLPAAASAITDTGAHGNRWKLLTFGGCGRNIAQAFCLLRPDIASRHIAVISGVDNLPPHLLSRAFNKIGDMQEVASFPSRGEEMPVLALAALGGHIGGDYAYNVSADLGMREARTQEYMA